MFCIDCKSGRSDGNEAQNGAERKKSLKKVAVAYIISMVLATVAVFGFVQGIYYLSSAFGSFL